MHFCLRDVAGWGSMERPRDKSRERYISHSFPLTDNCTHVQNMLMMISCKDSSLYTILMHRGILQLIYSDWLSWWEHEEKNTSY